VVDAEGRPKRLRDDAGGVRDCPDGSVSHRFLLPPVAAQRIAVSEGDARSIPGAGGLHIAEVAAWNPAYPWPGAESNVLDHGVMTGHSTTIGDAIRAYMRFFAGLQSAVGPVFATGSYGAWAAGYDSFYAGYLDGVWRSLSTGSADVPGDAYLVVPDYELEVFRPRAVAYGMGPYEQFFGSLPPGPLSEQQLDALRATTLAYGHAGGWAASGRAGSSERLPPAEQVKDYFVMQALQRRYLAETTAAVAYVDSAGVARDLGEALASDVDLAGPRLRIDYGDSLVLWINHSRQEWTVESGGKAYELPPQGYLAL
jgi:hypothetical protein